MNSFYCMAGNCNIMRSTSVVMSMKIGDTLASLSVQVRYIFAHERG
ncbi:MULTISPECIES: hypothetical protein [Butyricimonas]|uniref:Uncharacterized protein n=1 Tax=Butyricimonas paravirosa TaxID=1472417 RepID=A0A7X5YFI1_9BACT|nr:MULTISPECIES: hypothetical protein [Odoribacteraceae]NJC20164.1 hypothetical protein [Butyricimonas paravirosa]